MGRSGELAMEFRGVRRAFDTVDALTGLDLAIEPGTVTVLVGPNGAGKTTTVRLATGALAADGGTIRVLGADPAGAGQEIRRRCGVVPPKPAMYDRLTGRENLRYTADLFELDGRAPIEAVAEQFGIRSALDQTVAAYSTGMRTRLALARALLHDPELLLLDEPTAGLDPESSRSVLALMTDVTRLGRTVVICTHLLQEAEGVADQVVLLRHGRAFASGTPDELAARYWSGLPVRFEADAPDLAARLQQLPGVGEVRAEAPGVVAVLDGPERIPAVVQALVEAGVAIRRVEPQRPSLDRLYFEMQRWREP